MQDEDRVAGEQPQRAWKAPNLMVLDAKTHTRNWINPAPNGDSSTNYFTYES